MSDTRTIVTTLGADAMASELGVSRKSVTEAARLGEFPAAWWLVLSRMGKAHGLVIGEHLFSFRRGDAA